MLVGAAFMPWVDRFERSLSIIPYTTLSFSSIFLFSASSICEADIFFLAAVVAAGAPPFDALGTRTVPFLTAGALVPPTDMPPTFDVGGRPLAAAVYLFMF